MKITYLGHSCLWIETQEHTLMVDPFITGNDLAKSIDLHQYNPDFILITHAHQDHVLDVEKIATTSSAKIISNFEIVSYYNNKGFQGHGMNTGGSCEFPFGKVSCVVAHHSSYFADGTYGGNPNGYVLQCNGKSIYIAGDTGLTLDMQLIPQLYGEIDLAVLPIGDTFTMDAKAASIAAEFVQTKKILGCHYDTFPPIKIDQNKAKEIFLEKEQELIFLSIGEQISI